MDRYDIERNFSRILAHPAARAALDFVRSDDGATLAEQKTICAIASPPFGEQVRAADYCKRLAAHGLANARIDAEGNVIAVRAGSGGAPKLVVSAHLDTVFPEGTDVAVKEREGKLYAPGIGDDTRGLAELLSMVRALNAGAIRTVGDLYFVATVGEEGLGDLRGVKAFFRDHTDVDGFLSIDGPRPERITCVAVGSRRYRIAFKGPGGHSFNEFGQPSAIHAMGRAIAAIADLGTPTQPKTTFTVGTASGGTSVNSIAAAAVMEIDMRSVETQALLVLEAQIMKAIERAVAGENERWGRGSVEVKVECVGQRPAGSQPAEAPIMQAALHATRTVGLTPSTDEAASTDANLPISLGIPALTLGRGGKGGGTHTVHEWFDPTDAFLGPQRDLLTALALVGIEGVSEPVLPRR